LRPVIGILTGIHAPRETGGAENETHTLRFKNAEKDWDG
jgi:hypothetical protein